MRYVSNEFSSYYSAVVSELDTKYYDKLNELFVELRINTDLKLASFAIGVFVDTVGAACPELKLTLEVLGFTFDAAIFLLEAFTLVDERITEREMYLNLLVFYDAIGLAMNDTINGFSGVLIKSKDERSLECFEYGVSFYRSISALTHHYAERYLSMLYFDVDRMSLISSGSLDDTYYDLSEDNRSFLNICADVLGEDYVIEQTEGYENYERFPVLSYELKKKIRNILYVELMEFSKESLIVCHGQNGIINGVIESCYIIECPANITIVKNGAIVGDIFDDTLTLFDDEKGISIQILRKSENELAVKVLMLPEDYELLIMGNNNGTMSFEKAIIENGNVTTLSTITDVPVQNGFVYTEVIEEGITVALACDLDGDGTTDQTLSAEVQENTLAMGDLNDDTNIDASDAAMILVAAAAVGAGEDSGLFSAQEAAADVDSDGTFNAIDAAYILQYAAAAGAGYTGSFADFLDESAA